MLVDIATVYYRAYFSTPESLAKSGEPVAAVKGSLDALLLLVDRYQPERLGICWDLDWRPEWRVELLDTYKTSRVAAEDEEQMPDTLSDQVDLLRQILDELGVSQLGMDEFEADDLAAHHSRIEPSPIWVVSGDRDLFQLINDDRQVQVLYLGTGFSKHTVADGEYVRNRFGIEPHQYGEFSILRGDASDGLPGVKGVGEKTAAALLAQFGDLQNLLQACRDLDQPIKPRVRESLLAHEDYLERAKQVVLLHHDIESAPLEKSWLKPGTSATLERLGLSRYQQRWQTVVERIGSI